MARSDLTIVISGDTRGLKRATSEADRDLDKFGKSTKNRLGAMAKAAASAGVAFGAAGLAFGIKKAVDEWRDAEKVGKQTEAVLKSTAGVAKVTAGEVSRLAEKLSLVSGQDDELIQRGANLLLTFKGIRNEAGKNNDIFNQTVRTTLDMAAAMAAANDSEINLKTASIQVGKALNDPIKGMSALSRVGVTFSESQTKVIERLVASGNKMGAQKMILRELKSEFGGSARANADSMDRLGVAIDNLFEKFGKKLAPIITEAATKLIRFIVQMNNGRGAGGKFVRTLEDIWRGVKVVIDIFKVWIPIALKLPRLWVRIGVAAVEAGKAIIEAMRGAFNTVKKIAGDVIAFVLHRIEDLLGGLEAIAGFIPGLGDKIRDARREVGGLADRVDRLGESVRDLPKSRDIKVKVKFNPIGVDPFSPNLANPLGSGRPVSEFVDERSQRFMKRWAKKNPGKLSKLFGPSRFSGPLGARPTGSNDVDIFNRLAARFGLQITSGFRQGDDGWHGQDRARDYSNSTGPTPQMMAFARYMAANFGSRLLELIYTPLGFSIKNGQRTAPYAQSDHYDHVHVAMRRGGKVPGAGRGDRVPALLEPGEHIIKRSVAEKVRPLLEALNVQRFQGGGEVLPRSVYRAINAAMTPSFNAWAKKTYGMTGKRLLAKVAAVEGGGSIDEGTSATSYAGARGPFQFIASTRASYLQKYGIDAWKNDLSAAKAAMIHLRNTGIAGYNPGMAAYQGMVLGANVNTMPLRTGSIAGKAGETVPPLWRGGVWRTRGRRIGDKAPKGMREGVNWLDDGSAVKVKNGKIVAIRQADKEGRKLARERIPVKGRTTLPSIRETRQDLRYERQQESLEGIRDDDRVTRRERSRAERSYMQRAKVLNARRRAKQKRLKAINRELRGKLRPATRDRLLREKDQLVKDIGQIDTDLRQITYSFREQVAPFEPEPVEPESPFAQVEMQAALARLTPGTEDDLAAARGREYVAAVGLELARRSGDVAGVTEWANQLASAREAVEGLTGEMAEANRVAQERMELDRQLVKNQQTILGLQQSQGPQLIAGLAAILSGGIGGSVGLGRSYPSFAGLGGLART